MSDFDVAIVGGGPAGAATARTILQIDPSMNVVIYDARDPIGVPVNCAGAIAYFWLDHVGMKIPDKVIAQQIKGVHIHGPGGSEWSHHQNDIGEDDPIGAVMYRDKFDQWNLRNAEKAGADVQLGVNPARWSKKYDFGDTEYQIGADGWKSSFGRHCGFNTHINPDHLHIGVEYRMIVPEYDQDYLTLYIDNRYAPSGYLWIFPEGDNVVKIGLGIAKSSETSLKDYLDVFLKDHPEYDGERVEKTSSGSGWIPVSLPMDNFVKRATGVWYGLVGDAARQVDPLHGGGITNAMVAARILGQAIVAGKGLDKYQKEWTKRHRSEHERRFAMARTLDTWDNKQIEKFVSSLSNFSFKTSNMPKELSRLILHVVREAPEMFANSIIRILATYVKQRY